LDEEADVRVYDVFLVSEGAVGEGMVEETADAGMVRVVRGCFED
jgi:hypothetical protein